jgi:hypothetical protein
MPQVVELLAKGKTVRSVAAEVGLTEKTVHKWECLPRFQALLSQARREAFESGSSALISRIPVFAQVLTEATVLAHAVKSMDKDEAATQIRATQVAARAAEAGLTQALRCIELLSMAGEIEKLKARLKEQERVSHKKRKHAVGDKPTQAATGAVLTDVRQGAESSGGRAGGDPDAGGHAARPVASGSLAQPLFRDT